MDPAEWQLDPLIFQKISRLWQVEVDLFTSHWNAQLNRYVSWNPQPDA